MIHTFRLVAILFISTACFAQEGWVASIEFKGNEITKPQILLAELKIQAGDTLNLSTIQTSIDQEATRLYNLQLFHWVRATYTMDSLSIVPTVHIQYEMQERWYIWPIPIFSLADRNVNAWLQKMNFDRIDYGLHWAWYNFRGRNEQLISNIQHGFNRKYELFYRVPQINKKRNLGLDVGVSRYQSHFIDYINSEAIPLTLNLDNQFPIQRSYVKAGLINRHTVENIHTVHITLQQQQVADTVLALNPDYHLDGTTKTFVQLEAKKSINKRKTFSYPLAGHFLEFSFTQKIFFNSSESPTSQVNASYTQYIPLSAHWYYSIGGIAQYKYTQQQSTSENIALGYKQHIRGFDLYVIDGQHYAVAKQQITRKLADVKMHLGFIPSKKFNDVPLQLYLGPFTELGYVDDRLYATQNPLSNTLLYSTGLSLHAVSYYDQVFVLDYTLNSLKEHGIFVSAKFPF